MDGTKTDSPSRGDHSSSAMMTCCMVWSISPVVEAASLLSLLICWRALRTASTTCVDSLACCWDVFSNSERLHGNNVYRL